MKLTPEEIKAIREEHGLHVTEKCNECRKVLNQSVRYTTPDRKEVWCSAACQDKAMGWDQATARKKSAPAFHVLVCQNCTKRFRAKHEDARYCSERCKKSSQRKRKNGVVPQTVQPPLAEAHG